MAIRGNMNTKSATLFAVVGIVCLLGILPMAAAQATVTIDDASAQNGQTTTAEIRAHNVTNLMGFAITLEYDPDVVMVIDEEINSAFGENVSVIANNTNGSVILGSFSTTADVTSADVLLATVTLRADGAAGEQSTLNITASSLINTTDDQILPRSAIDGTFTVNEPPTVTIDDASAQNGQTTTAEIRAHNVTNLMGFAITLEYDPDVVMVIDEEINSAFGENVSVIANNTNGSVILGSFSTTADVTSADVLLATVTLRADGAAGEQSTLNITASSLINTTDDQILPRSAIDGTFTVNGPPTVTIDDASAQNGQTTTAEIRVHNVTNLMGFAITLEYDQTVVMVIDEEINSTFGENVSVIANNTNGSVILGSFSTTADVTSADVLLATVTLRADGAAGEQSTLNITASSLINTTDDQILPRIAIDGTFTVGANIVSIADVTLPYGSTQTVPIQLLNSTGVGGVNVTLTFNRSIVNTTTAVVGDFTDNFNVDYSNVSNGVLRVTCMKSGQNLTGDKTIATVTLHAVNTSGTCGLNLSAELFNRTGADVSSTVSNGTFMVNTTAATTPPAPENLQYTINGDWVNYTWQAGSIGHGTDSYNVSLGGLWGSYNGTATFLNTSVGAGNWSNITVWAYNNTDSGNLSLSSVSDEVQATVNATISLNTGWNLITMPLNSTTPYTAKTLCVAVGANCTSVARWTATGWEAFECSEPGGTWSINNGEGYFVRVSSDTTFEVSGTNFTTPISLDMSTGWNLIGIPHSTTSYTAKTLCVAVGANCTSVARWTATGWEAFECSEPGGTWSIEDDHGYFVRVGAGTYWTPT